MPPKTIPDFAARAERHRRELQVHCYRMLGSFDDAEDLVQETFMRAWRARARFTPEGGGSFRAWLFRIATNACLDALAKQPRRVLPPDVVPAGDPELPPPPPMEGPWLEPYLTEDDPDAAVVAKETIELAFLAAIQHLPPRQRAVLILRDVVGFSAKETAALLNTTVAAANSALQRARETLRKRLPARREDWAPPAPSEEERALLRRYVAALEEGDAAAFAALLRDDVRVSFPPRPLWYDGRDAFLRASRKHAAPGEHRFVPTTANGQLAIEISIRPPGDSEYRPLALEVLRFEDGLVAEIIDFGRDR